MTVSGKRAGVEFIQTIQSPLVNVQESGLASLVVGPLYQSFDAIVADKANPSAIARNADGDVLLYDGEQLVGADSLAEPLQINFYSDEAQTNAVALPSLLPKSLILPNARTAGAVAADTFFKVFLNYNDEFVELTGPGTGVEFDYDLVVAGPGAFAGETLGIVLKPNLEDSVGNAFNSLKRPQVVIAMRALRRDYSRKVLKTTATGFEAIAGGVFGPENPAAFAMQKAFEASPANFAYLIAVDEVTDGEPEGTYGAYLRALELAATVDVYTVMVPTYNLAVLNAVKSHVLDMSTPEGRKERIGLVGATLPTRGPDEVQVSGVGDLKPVAANLEIGGDPDEFHIFSELEQSGSALNSLAFLSFIDGGGSGPVLVDYAGARVLGAAADGTTVAGSAVISVAAVDPAAVAPEAVEVGDGLRWLATEADVGGTSTTTAATQLLFHPGRNFKELGVNVNDRVWIGTIAPANRYAVNRILGDVTTGDTLELVPVGHNTPVIDDDSVTTLTYFVEIETTVTKLTGAGPWAITTDGLFDFSGATLAIEYLDSVKIDIIVDNQDESALLDSWDLVSLLSNDFDASALATFFVGADAVRGVVYQPALPTAHTYAGGSDDFLQFFANADLGALALPASPGAPVGLEKDVYLDLESENRDPLVVALRQYNGSVVVADPGGASQPDLTGLKVNELYSLYVFGDALTINTPLGPENDLQLQAETLALFPVRFSSRRIRAIWPDVAFTEVSGVQVEAEGYFLGATLAGMVSALFPEQGHSELPFPGWVSLEHSNDYFKESQLEILTAAGWWVYVQDTEGGPIVCRKQYTTDPSGDITAEASFTTIADNFQKDIRVSTKPLLGVNNITPDLIDRVRLLIQSVGKRYENRQAIKSYTLNSLEPSREPGDLTTMVGDITLEFYGPFNLLRIRVNL